MQSEQRRKEILNILHERTTPVSASSLAEMFGVTRQIIVKDIALLRAEKADIISTSRGYIINSKESTGCNMTVNVCHDAEKIQDELETIIDLGGRVLTTSVEHPFYGTLGETLNIKSRKDIRLFLDKVKSTGCEPLLKLTLGKHSHVIEADDQQTLKEIKQALMEKGYLCDNK